MGRVTFKIVFYEKFDWIRYLYKGDLLRTKNPFCVRFPVSLALKKDFGIKNFSTNDEKMIKWINMTYLAPNTINLYKNLRVLRCD